MPDYYRDTPFSSAWMRLTSIEAEPIRTTKFFGCYAFERAPALAGITHEDGQRFVNKLVLDADELRAMDTTIWRVRPARSDDRHDRILVARQQTTQALSERPIPLRSSRILHLSDLHFATERTNRNEHIWELTGEGGSTLQQRIVQALGGDRTVGLVVISGDLTFRAADDEFYEAFRFVHGLMGALGLGPGHLVVVPGNHDLAWTRQRDQQWNRDETVTEAPASAQRAYRESFYDRVFRHAAAEHLGMARRFICPNGLVLEVGGLNSSSLEQGSNWLAGMGRVNDAALTDIAETLEWKADRASMALRLLVHHHHLTPIEDVVPTSEFYRGFGMAADAKRTLRQAARHNVQLVLHGHRHQPFIETTNVYAELEHAETKWQLGRVGIIGAGSAGSTSVNNNDNYFNILEIQGGQLDLQVFRARSPHGSRGDFRMIQEWSAPMLLEAGQLRLGDWALRRRSAG
ncbi:3',5'-cyclic adenosine monophosphate phosphodiesterase CpdA [Enhygromyxa salina]|uniref:3',5'-cyclic adenosine monophosphate phosphodiesterase CpdA n=1 Tax=Enhygromyxa salina TaxID=215803 RepID=A0A2S9XUD4_9BACT|nr:3',5'-cyclic adenosine monophosphate phosphodiesterase CpdA [Enhygromyxa salina]